MRVYTLGESEFSKALTKYYWGGRPMFQGLGADTGIREFVNEAQAKAIVAALRQGVTIANNAINYLTPTTIFETFLAWTPLGWAVRLASPEYANQLISEQKGSALKNVADTIPLIDKLGGVWFEAAKTGISAPDGLSTWTKWKENAELIADALKSYVDYQASAAVYFNAPKLIADMVITVVNCITQPEKCGVGLPKTPDLVPWWVKGIGIGAGLVAGAYVFNTVFRR